MRLRRAISLITMAALVWALCHGASYAKSERVTEVEILSNLQEIGMESDLQLFAYTAPATAADRTVTWRAMSAAEGLCAIAKTRLNTPYELGSNGPNSFDCSGFVGWCLSAAGVPFAWQSSYAWRNDRHFLRIDDMHDIKTGDVLVFYGDTSTSLGHVGIYLGDGKMIDASSSQGRVRITSDVSPDKGYWQSVFCAAYRIYTNNGAAVITEDGVLRATAAGRIAVTATANDGGGAMAVRFFDVLPLCGMGTEEAPFLVSTTDTLRDVVNYGNYVFQLTRDLDLSAACAQTGGFLPIGTEEQPFIGTLDGNGFCISGLTQTIQSKGTALGGLFGVLQGTVKNLTVRADIAVSSSKGDAFAGAIAAKVNGGYILSCAAAGNVAADTAGGLVGYLYGSGGAYDCASLISVSGDTAGGLVGKVDARAKVLRSCAYGSVSGGDDGAVVGCLRGGLADCYYLERGMEAFGKGGNNGRAAALTLEMLPYASSYPALRIPAIWHMQDGCAFALPSSLSLEKFLPQDTVRFAGGSGVPYAPYCVETAKQLSCMAEEPDAFFALTADITLDAPFTPIGTAEKPFRGALDGGGHTLHGLSVQASDAGGLFGYTENAAIGDLSIRGGSVEAEIAGLLIGVAGNTQVKNCSVTGTVNGKTAGGVLGCLRGGEMEALYSGALVMASDTGGGVVGRLDGQIFACCASGDVSGTIAGGVVGEASGSAADCFYTGKAAGKICGGVVGSMEGEMARCYTLSGAVAGKLARGGAAEDCLDDVSALEGANTAVFHNFDFTQVWTMDGSAVYAYPELRRVTYLPGLVTDIRVSGASETPIGFAEPYVAATDPIDAEQSVFWRVEPLTGKAEITEDGVLTGVAAGTVKVVCEARDGGSTAGSVVVTILDARVDALVLRAPDQMSAGQSEAFTVATAPYEVDTSRITVSSSDSSVVSVDAESGVLHANVAGEAVISAFAGGKSVSKTVYVRAVATELQLSAESLVLPVGSTDRLTYTLTPETASGSVRFSSGNAAVVAVDQYGFVTALSLGEAVVSCSVEDGARDKCTIFVVKGILSFGKSVFLRVGERQRLSPVCQMGTGYRNPSLRYSSSNETVARVSWRGVVRATGAGTCEITAYDRRDPTFFATVTVTVAP